MKNQHQHIQDEMRRLIAKSCDVSELASNAYTSFHKSLLKYYFDVSEVTIDYDRNSIFLWTSSQHSFDPESALYQLNDATPLRIAYDNLQETLKGCLDNRVNSIRFYRSLLFHYNNVEQVIPRDAMTA
ncbi:hypothetical protein [Altibacter sp. HG106]|uniref:hypothetical protein n=1 Tax=Altibacter sp. HG106 TaxID=3023937 RepID=UPI00234FDA37|nr:hypothetical protein [Altibacter sp. HG106]MDC7996153.1 hypothetical protein [Altibacter sp. HG106]